MLRPLLQPSCLRSTEFVLTQVLTPQLPVISAPGQQDSYVDAPPVSPAATSSPTMREMFASPSLLASRGSCSSEGPPGSAPSTGSLASSNDAPDVSLLLT